MSVNYVSYDNIKKIIKEISAAKQKKIPVSETKGELQLADGEIGIALEDGIFYRNGDELVAVSGKGNEINLSGYYTKEETYAQAEIDKLLARRLSFEVVDNLPTENIGLSTIYFVRRSSGGNGKPSDAYDEYIYVNGNWELIGDTDIDLSGYYTKEETDGKIGEISGSMNELSQGLETLKETLKENLSNETLNRAEADEELEKKIDELSSSVDSLTESVAADRQRAEQEEVALGERIDAEETARTEADDILGERIDAIDEKIPSAASAENQLADRAFVNSSIGTNTAYFVGTFDSLEELNEYDGDKTNNDYAFVKTTDSDGSTLYNRYKWSDEENNWLFEYTLNNSSFTQTQWNAINSGATEELVEKIKDGNGTKTGLLRLSDAVDGTQGTDDATAATPSAVKMAYDLANAANENADTSLNRLGSEVAARQEADDALGKRIDGLGESVDSLAARTAEGLTEEQYEEIIAILDGSNTDEDGEEYPLPPQGPQPNHAEEYMKWLEQLEEPREEESYGGSNIRNELRMPIYEKRSELATELIEYPNVTEETYEFMKQNVPVMLTSVISGEAWRQQWSLDQADACKNIAERLEESADIRRLVLELEDAFRIYAQFEDWGE